MCKEEEKMSNKHRRLIVITAFVALAAYLAITVLPILINVRAATQQEIQKKITAAQKNKAEAQKKIDGIQGEKKVAEADKERLDKAVTAINGEILAVNQEIEESDTQIVLLEEEITAAEEEIVEYDDQFKTRARVMYFHGSATHLDVLFSAENFSDLLYKAEIVKQIVEHDRGILQKMADAKEVIVNSKAEVENQKAKTVLNRELLQAKQDELQVSLAAREQTLQKLLSDEKTANDMIDKYDREEESLKRDLQAQLAKPQTQQSAPPAQYTGGRLLWPCPSTSTITSPYGNRLHPIQGRTKKHTGIDIGVAYGGAIVAAEGGTVMRSGWNGGYGNYIVINHGGGLQTLYAHNSSNLVAAGQTVTRGQKIALAGSTGNSTGPHLHFEVLVNGVDTDPMGYLR